MLLYHRIGTSTIDPWALTVSRQHFLEHLDVLSGRRVLPLGAMVEALRDETLPARSVAMTFDDGYAETTAFALHRLESLGFPATFYVCSGAVGSPLEFWWDQLERLLFSPPRLPQQLCVQTRNGDFEFTLGDKPLRPGDQEDGGSSWRYWDSVVPSGRHDLFRQLWQRCRDLPADERGRLIRDLSAWAGVEERARPSHRVLSAEELRRLACSGIAEIGGHTVTHPVLAVLAEDEQRSEIVSDRRALERLTGRSLRSFAYPYGRSTDYSPTTVRVLRRAGYDNSCCNVAGTLTCATNPYELPRLFVQDWDGEELSRQLAALERHSTPARRKSFLDLKVTRRSAMRVLEVTSVLQTHTASGVLEGAHVDLPRAGDHVEPSACLIQGWVVGRRARAVRVEITANGRIRGRLPVNARRDDVAAHLPAVPTAGTSGFTGRVDLSGDVQEFEIHAVLDGGERAELASVKMFPSWRELTHPSERGVVSIVIPCFNQAHFLSEAIESALEQTHSPVEVIVVDDGSTDNTIAVASRYDRVTYVRQPNRGLGAARNTGLRRSNGEYVVFLDADDRLLRDAVSTNLRHLRRRPECALVYGEFRHIGVDGSVIGAWSRPPIAEDPYTALLRGNHIGMHATVLYRRALFQTIGGFDERLTACEDYELLLRAARSFPVCGHSELVAEYRRHGSAMSMDLANMLRTCLSVLRAQRTFVKGDAARRAAYREGLRRWRALYADDLFAQAADDWRYRRRRRKAAAAMLRLA